MYRSSQRSQKVREVVQPRPTCAEKVRRLKSAPLLGLSNRPTSSNLHAHPRARTRAYMRVRARTPVCVYLPRQVGRLDSGLIQQGKNRPTSKSRLGGFGEVGR